jgi:signal transduction histidine kinase
MPKTVAGTTNFQVLFEKTPGLCLALDPNFFILAASDNYLRATMTRREDIVGQHLFDVFPDNPVDAPTAFRNLRNSLERVVRDRVPDSMDVQRYDIRRPGGGFEERYWSAVNIPILRENGEAMYIIHCLRDTTEFPKASDDEDTKWVHLQQQRVATMQNEVVARSEELRAANQQLHIANDELALRTAELNDLLQTIQTFTYSIAHDLRAPLRGLMGFSTVLVDDYGDKLDDTGKGYLRHIKDAAHKMDRLLKDMLAYGQLTHVEVTAVPMSLESVVNAVLEELSSFIRNRKAVVEVHGHLPSVVGNAALVNQVLLNLIDNALKFVPADRAPRVVIQASESENHVRVSVKDNGIGIAPAYHARIFDLFVRLHKPAAYPGTGIGLALVKKAMDRMMGKVGVESVPGQGSCFWLELRAAR